MIDMFKTHNTASDLLRGYLAKGLAASALLVSVSVVGQGSLVDARDQAEGWYVPVHGQVLIEGKKADSYKVFLYRDNVLSKDIECDKKGRFELELDLDATYAIVIRKDGYQEKLVQVNTTIPKSLVKYPAYECTVSLQKQVSGNVDPFYSDFPSAIIRYNEELGGFYHSEHYFTHIQTKMSGYAKVGM